MQESPLRPKAGSTIVRPGPRTGITPAKERERKAQSVIEKVIGFRPTLYDLCTLCLSSGSPLIAVSWAVACWGCSLAKLVVGYIGQVVTPPPPLMRRELQKGSHSLFCQLSQ